MKDFSNIPWDNISFQSRIIDISDVSWTLVQKLARQVEFEQMHVVKSYGKLYNVSFVCGEDIVKDVYEMVVGKNRVEEPV